MSWEKVCVLEVGVDVSETTAAGQCNEEMHHSAAQKLSFPEDAKIISEVYLKSLSAGPINCFD